ncbi:MAG: CBS domain-containing protein [Angustibacter sp.]
MLAVQVRDIMTTSVICATSDEPVVAAAQRMRDLDIGALPVRGDDDVLSGVVTDRDLVLRVLAEGADAGRVTVGSVVRAGVVTVTADAEIADAARLMGQHRIRRLVVVSGRWVVGIVSQGDLARALPEDVAGVLAEAVSA